MQLANDMLTQVRRRVIREQKGRRGRLTDPARVNRRLLLRAGDTLSAAALTRLKATLRADDPTDEMGAAWGVKEQLRQPLASGCLADAHEQRMLLGLYVLAAGMPETDRLWTTITDWWPAIEVLLVTASPTPAPKQPTPASSRSSAPAAATGTPLTTAPVSSWPVPPDARHEHPPQHPTSR